MTVALVPDWVCNAPLKASALALYTRMAVRCDFATREIVRDHAELAEMSGTSVATVKRCLDELASIGAVLVTARRRGKFQTANRYTLPREQLTSEQLTDERLAHEPPTASPSSSPVSYQLPEELQTAAAASVDSDPSTGELPIAAEEGDTAFQACLQIAKRKIDEDRKVTGKRITNLTAYARPRAADLLTKHRAGIDELLARGASLTEVADFVAHAEADPLIEHQASPMRLTPVRPRLPEFRQGAFDDTLEWRQQQPISLDDVRARLAEARMNLTPRQEATS